MHSAHRPRRLSDLLPHPPTASGIQPAQVPAKRLRGHSLRAERAFTQALAHARTYYEQHGHLTVPKDDTPAGYPLGMRLFSQRNRAKQRARAELPPSPHPAELAAIDPWWNPPWDLPWQRNYYHARDHVEAGRPFDPAALIPSPCTVLGRWITRACLQYHQLHPGQQHLLTLIGITPESPCPTPWR